MRVSAAARHRGLSPNSASLVQVKDQVQIQVEDQFEDQFQEEDQDQVQGSWILLQ